MERANERNQLSKTAGGKEKKLPYSVETPYGFHLDLDFLKYVDDIEKGNTIKKIHISRKSKQSKFSTLPRNFSVPDNESRAHTSSASQSWTTNDRPSISVREPVEAKGQGSLPVNASSQHLQHLQELNYRRKTNVVEASSQADIILHDGFITLNGRPNLFRASSMPAALPYDKNADEPNLCSTFCQYPVTCQPCGGNNIKENDFGPMDSCDWELAQHKEHINMKQQINEAFQRIKDLADQVKAIPELNQQIMLLTEEKLELSNQLQIHQEMKAANQLHLKYQLQAYREMEEQVKTIPELNRQILLLTGEKLQLTNQLQAHQKLKTTLLNKETLTDTAEINSLNSVAETSSMLTVQDLEPLNVENQRSEGIELNISESEPHNSANSDIKNISPSLAKHNVNLEPLLSVSLQHMVAKALRQKASNLEEKLNEKTEALEETKRLLQQQNYEIEARGRHIQDLENTIGILEEHTKESQIIKRPELQYCDTAVNTVPWQAKEDRHVCDKAISVNITPGTKSIGCGEFDVNIIIPPTSEVICKLCGMSGVPQASLSTSDKESDIDVVNENVTRTNSETPTEAILSIMSEDTELKIEESFHDCELRSEVCSAQSPAPISTVENPVQGSLSMKNGNSKFHPSNETPKKQPATKEQDASPPDATVGQYVKKIQELIHEQWTCLEHGYPELANAIRQPASKLSSIQNQLVNSLNLLSSVYTSQTSSDEENVKAKYKEMETSPTTSLKSIMKKKGHGSHARGNGAKKNLQFVGVNGGYETTSSEEDSSSEGCPDSDTEKTRDPSEETHVEDANDNVQAPPEMTTCIKGTDQTHDKLQDPTTENTTECPPERCKLEEEFLHQCHLLSNHLSEINSTPEKQMRETLSIICQEWFRVSSQKSSTSSEVEAYLKEFSSISPQLLKMVLNMADGNGNTALHYSVSHSNFSIVKLLLDTGVCDVNHQNKAGYTAVMLTPLASAETDEDMKVVLTLLKQGDVNTRARRPDSTHAWSEPWAV
ncbi:KN motif and ankyrin repeat domain-containing protein 4 isoform X2 [Lissotriton helveticus]